MKETERLKKEIATLESKLASIKQRGEDAQRRENEAEHRRKEFVVAAFEGDVQAQRHLDKWEAEREKAAREARDAGLAAQEISKKLERAKFDLAIAEKRETAERVHELSRQLVGNAKRVETAWAELAETIGQVLSTSGQIGEALHRDNASRWGSDFVGAPVSGLLRDFLSFNLALVLEDKHEAAAFSGERRGPIAARAEAYFTRLVTKLRNEAEHEARKASGRIEPKEGEVVYRARHRILGVRDVDVAPGELICLTPEEAAQLGEAVEPAGKTAQQEHAA